MGLLVTGKDPIVPGTHTLPTAAIWRFHLRTSLSTRVWPTMICLGLSTGHRRPDEHPIQFGVLSISTLRMKEKYGPTVPGVTVVPAHQAPVAGGSDAWHQLSSTCSTSPS